MAILSACIIGLGQIIKGDSDKGIKWMLFFYFFFPALTYVALKLHGYAFLFIFGFGIIAYPIFWIYNILDALMAQSPLEKK